MSDPIIEATPEGEPLVITPKPKLVVVSDTDSQAQLGEAMLASMERTAFARAVRIPVNSQATLAADNERILSQYGDGARRIFIGPDIVASESRITTIKDKHVAELLGLIIFKRQFQSRSHYYALGFDKGSLEASRGNHHAASVNWLLRNLLDYNDDPIVRERGSGRGREYGMIDVVVEDLRYEPRYREVRAAQSLEGIDRYIRRGGTKPCVDEPGAFDAAMSIIDQLCDETMDKDTFERFVEISHQVPEITTKPQAEDTDPNLDDELFGDTLDAGEKRDQENQPWQTKSACKEMGKAFYPPDQFERQDEKLEREAKAKAICATCSVKKECLEYALSRREKDGIWGGLNEVERKQYLVGL